MNIPNRITREMIDEKTRETGADAAKGVDAQIRFQLVCLEGAYHAVLDPVIHKDKKTGDVVRDDAADLAKLYYESRSKANIFDAKAANIKKLVSTTRLVLRGGQCQKGDILATVNELMSIRSTLRKDPKMAPHVIDATNVLHTALRLQLKADRSTPLEHEEMKAICLKKPKNPKSLEKFWEDLAETFRKLKVGSLAASTLQDTVPMVDQIEQMAKERVKQLTTQQDAGDESDEAEETAATQE